MRNINLGLAFVHLGEPANRIHLVSTRPAKIVGATDHDELQRLRIKRWWGISSPFKASWFFGLITWTQERR